MVTTWRQHRDITRIDLVYLSLQFSLGRMASYLEWNDVQGVHVRVSTCFGAWERGARAHVSTYNNNSIGVCWCGKYTFVWTRLSLTRRKWILVLAAFASRGPGNLRGASCLCRRWITDREPQPSSFATTNKMWKHSRRWKRDRMKETKRSSGITPMNHSFQWIKLAPLETLYVTISGPMIQVAEAFSASGLSRMTKIGFSSWLFHFLPNRSWQKKEYKKCPLGSSHTWRTIYFPYLIAHKIAVPRGKASLIMFNGVNFCDPHRILYARK